MSSEHELDESGTARLLLALLALVWGVNWPIMKIALDEVGPVTMRVLGYSIGAATLFAVIVLQRRNAEIPRGTARWHILGASAFNIIGMGLFISFAQMSATTSRVVIISYSMPIWSSLLAWLLLGERLNGRSVAGLALCIAGLTTLVYPIAATASPLGLMLAVGCSLCWGLGTIYMKWARIPGDLVAIAAWQTLVGVVVIGAGFLLFRGLPDPEPVSLKAMLAVLYNGVLGVGFAFFLWFTIIERLPTATASLGSLATPVVGVLSSMAVLSERPTLADLVGFALIFAAAACVLVPPRRRSAAEDLGAR